MRVHGRMSPHDIPSERARPYYTPVHRVLQAAQQASSGGDLTHRRHWPRSKQCRADPRRHGRGSGRPSSRLAASDFLRRLLQVRNRSHAARLDQSLTSA